MMKQVEIAAVMDRPSVHSSQNASSARRGYVCTNAADATYTSDTWSCRVRRRPPYVIDHVTRDVTTCHVSTHSDDVVLLLPHPVSDAFDADRLRTNSAETNTDIRAHIRCCPIYSYIYANYLIAINTLLDGIRQRILPPLTSRISCCTQRWTLSVKNNMATVVQSSIPSAVALQYRLVTDRSVYLIVFVFCVSVCLCIVCCFGE